MKRSRLVTRLLVLIAIFAIAGLAWKFGLIPGAHPKCEPMRFEQKDGTGKVVKIIERTCLGGN